MRSLSVRDKILLVAAGLPREPFTDARLVVECWRRWPATFGLSGYHTVHPDSARVTPRLATGEVLLKTGLIERVDEGTYVVTSAGYQRADALLEDA